MMNFDSLRRALDDRSDVRSEQVYVNQRNLIDKILARYSAEFTVYREMIQNANDAGARNLEIHFTTAEAAKKKKEASFVTAVTVQNDGRVFSPADWTRLKSIAEGNPDEAKIGFFGVGFYSLFSICEEPMVVSGGQCLTFFWKTDQLFTKQGDISISSAEGKESKWTAIYLRLREPMECPDLDAFGHFLAKSLLFCGCLEGASVHLNQELMFSIKKKQSPASNIPSPTSKLPTPLFTLQSALSTCNVQLTLDKRYSSEPARRGFLSDLWRSAREVLSGEAELAEAARAPGTFHLFLRLFSANLRVSLPTRMAGEMERVMKKRPAAQVQLHFVYSSKSELDASDYGTGRGVRHPVLSGIIPTHPEHGRLFIGFETHQSTGIAVHICGPFVPTVERESLDFVDASLRHWNEQLIAASGALVRLVWDYEVESVGKMFVAGEKGTGEGGENESYRSASIHLLRSFSFHPTAPAGSVRQLMAQAFLSQPGLLLPSSVGARPIAALRFVPADMRSFLRISCPQPLDVPDEPFLDDFISAAAAAAAAAAAGGSGGGGLREAGVEEVCQELGMRVFGERETVRVLRWLMDAVGQGRLPQHAVKQLTLALHVPCGDCLEKQALAGVKYFPSSEVSGWPLPGNCLSAEYYEKADMTAWEWRRLGLQELDFVTWLAWIVQTERFVHDAGFVESVVVLCSRQAWREDVRIISILANCRCVPAASGDTPNITLMHPKDSYLEAVRLFKAVPVAAFRQASLSAEFLKAIGVQTHLPTDQIIDSLGRLDWDHRHLLQYLNRIRGELTDLDLVKLRAAQIFPDTTTDKSRRFRLNELYEESPAARLLALPCLDRDMAMLPVVGLAGFNGWRIPTSQIVKWLAEHEGPAESRLVLFRHLWEYQDHYQGLLTQFNKTDYLESTGPNMVSPGAGFADSRAASLGFAVVHERVRPFAALLGVRQLPDQVAVISVLTERRFDSKNAEAVFSLAGELLDSRACRQLSTVPFVPLDKSHAAPQQVFFGMSGEFRAVLGSSRIVDFGRGNAFLRACGAREEPSVGQLLEALAGGAEGFLAALGYDRYVGLLRLFSVSLLDSPSISPLRTLPILLGVTDPSNPQESAVLCTSQQVFLLDDALSQRHFGMPVAPLELESYYGGSLGVQAVSRVVRTEWTFDGACDGRAQASQALRRLLSERAPLIVKELRTTQPDQARRLLDTLSVQQVASLHISRTFSRLRKAAPSTACLDQRRSVLLHTADVDMFDVAAALVPVLVEGPKLSDSLLLATLLTTPLESLQARGFISVKAANVPIDGEEMSAAVQSIGVKDVSSNSVPLANNNESSESVRLLDADERKTNEQEPKSIPPQHNPPPPPAIIPPSSPKKKDFGDLIKSIFAGGRQRKSSTSTSSSTSITTESPVKMTSAMSKEHLQRGIAASRPNRGQSVPGESERQPPPPASDSTSAEAESHCRIIGAEGLHYAGIVIANQYEYYSPTGSPPNAQEQAAATSFAKVVLDRLTQVFTLHPPSLHIYHLPASPSIAFNRGGSLFLNLAYYTQEDAPTALISWFMTICHELAHNYVGPHDALHEHYMMAYAEGYLPRLLPFLH